MLISGFERVLFIVNSAVPPRLLVELAPAIFVCSTRNAQLRFG
jgi:hypothetical protein